MTNDEAKVVMEALGGSPASTASSGGDGTDWKTRCEEAERKLASAQVEQGRVRKLDAELKEARSKIAELEKAAVPEGLKDVPEEITDAARYFSQQAVAGMGDRMAQLERQVEEDKNLRLSQMANEFASRINQNFPEFAKGLKGGGAFKAAWDEYQRYNAASIKDAFARLDYETLAYHIRSFYEKYDVDPSGGREQITAPDPRAMGGGNGATITPKGKETMTPEEWEGKLDSLQDQYERGILKPDAYVGERQKLMDAYKEGRVKPKTT